MSKTVLDYSAFKYGSGTASGGVTGSSKMEADIGGTSSSFQLKKSILDASSSRRRMDGGKDHENFGEFIASQIGRHVLGSAVPEVFLVPDKEKNRVMVASKYLNGALGTLDEYAEKDGVSQRKKFSVLKKKPKKEHVIVTFGESDAYNHKYGLKEKHRTDVARSMAYNVLCGNHDVNPGNLIVTNDGICPIDFGKAFNKLITGPELIGGQIRNKDNRILDFLNRETVTHLKPGHRQSKLWRDYENLVPSQELAKALKDISEAPGIQSGVEQAKAGFLEIMEQFKENPGMQKHIVASLREINRNIGALPISDSDPANVINKVFDNIKNFYVSGQKQMADTAKLMQLQVDIDAFIHDKNNKQLKDKIISAYNGLQTKPGIKTGNNEIGWIKTSKTSPSFKGTLDQYIKHRTKELASVVISPKISLLKRLALQFKKTHLKKEFVNYTEPQATKIPSVDKPIKRER